MFSLIIIVIGVIIIGISLKGIQKDSNSFDVILDKEKVNKNRDYDREIILIRKDLAETVMDLQKEIEEIKKNVNEIKKGTDNYIIEEDIDDDELERYEYIEESIVSEINFSNKLEENKDLKSENIEKLKENKISKVKKLIEIGLRDDEICSELAIGKGEVLLIKSLLK